MHQRVDGANLNLPESHNFFILFKLIKAEETKKMQKCADCKYWDNSKGFIDKEDNLRMGLCHRYPPTFHPKVSMLEFHEKVGWAQFKGFSPITSEEDGCGEHHLKH